MSFGGVLFRRPWDIGHTKCSNGLLIVRAGWYFWPFNRQSRVVRGPRQVEMKLRGVTLQPPDSKAGRAEPSLLNPPTGHLTMPYRPFLRGLQDLFNFFDQLSGGVRRRK